MLPRDGRRPFCCPCVTTGFDADRCDFWHNGELWWAWYGQFLQCHPCGPATSVGPLRHDPMQQGPTEPHAGRGALLSSGGAEGGYYRAASGAGPPTAGKCTAVCRRSSAKICCNRRPPSVYCKPPAGNEKHRC